MAKIDFVADVHGYADHLEELLKKLGYRYRNGAYRHSDPNRIAVSVGDLMDRGPRQFDSIDIFRRMRDAGTGTALMGNHEHAAIGWIMPDELVPGNFLRKRSEKNYGQHKAFLDQIGEGSDLHRELVAWMITMPIIFDGEGVRAAHACWDPKALLAFDGNFNADASLPLDVLLRTYVKDSWQQDAIDQLLRGPEVDLPEGVSYLDAQGTRRTTSRLRWWDETLTTYRDGAITDEVSFSQIPVTRLPEESLIIDRDPRPMIFGHYWLPGEPMLLSGRRACLDFSVAAGGPLVAYQWDGEETLTAENLVSVGGPDFAIEKAMAFGG
jgi:hypothetical protein